MTADRAIQSAVRRAVMDVTAGDERVHVTHAVASTGWGDVLYVDVYARSRAETLEDLDPELRTLVAVVAERPFERVAIRWRLSNRAPG
jgi:hypothetical protein